MKVPTLVVTFLIGAITLIAPDRAAAASQYRWSADGGGTWATASNWTLVSGPLGAGYPNLPGDVAQFESSDNNRTIAINQTISIARLVIDSTGSVSFFTTSNGRLVFDDATPGAGGETYVETLGTGAHVISVPMMLAETLRVVVNNPAGRLACAGGIAESGGEQLLDKSGPGTLHFTSVQDNTYLGLTLVREGVLELQHFGSIAVSGDLVIGAGTVGAPTAILRLRNDEQIADDRAVNINQSGVFELASHTERVGNTHVNSGTISIGSTPTDNAELTLSLLTLFGGTIQIARNSALTLTSNITATSNTAGRALISGEGTVRLNGATRIFTVYNGSQAVDMEIQAAIVGTGSEGLIKRGEHGVLRFTGATSNEYTGLTAVEEGRLELARTGGVSIPGSLLVQEPDGGPSTVAVLTNDNIRNSANVKVSAGGEFRVDALELIDHLIVDAGGLAQIGAAATARLTLEAITLLGGRIAILPTSSLRMDNLLAAVSTAASTATIEGGGTLVFNAPTTAFEVGDGPQAIDLQISCAMAGGSALQLRTVMPGTIRIDGSGGFAGTFQHRLGQLFINGSLPNMSLELYGGRLGGTGRTGPIDLGDSSTIAPGLSPGILTTGTLGGTPDLTLAVELNGTTPGTGYDQLKVIGEVALNAATLSVTASFAPPPGSRFIIIDNDGSDPVGRDDFHGLPEGATLTVGGRELTITYTGGDGNDVELFSNAPQTYFLAEGATGGFFDDDVLIANPTTTEAPVTMTFLLEGGGTVVEQRTIAPQSRMTVHVDQIPGLEDASPSVQVVSNNRVPLVVERTMFWDPTYYGGHTANAVAQPELRWVFAEGFQGFFDTYVLIANANPEPVTATITFLRENDAPVVQTVPVGAFARKTIYAGDYSDVVGRAFGIVVEATRPVIAERAMYFASLPGRLWSGGHANTGIASPSMSWFHAEGATGAFFNTFILLSNPQDAPAHVTLRFLLSTGEVIERTKTIEARQRMTINPAAEGDPRLENAALSTVVQSDVPIVSERSMYWPGDALPFGEGHNSAGVVTTAMHWGLAEGRVGGPHQFQTYVLLANPETTAAEVTVTFLRENGTPPVVKTYNVPATSRFNIDLATVQELSNESFGVRIDVTNGVNIAVERSLYWNANGVFWAGGTNALATPLP
jgi:autotransporter-associated beta strand protein